MHLVGHTQLDAGRFPARPIEHQHNLLGGTGPHLAGEGGELHFNDGDADGRWQMGQMEDGPTRGGMDKADQIPPGEAMLHAGNGPLSNRGPDAPQQRFEADAMFVGRPHSPQLDLCLRKGGGDRP
jgi:hypothetical protein